MITKAKFLQIGETKTGESQNGTWSVTTVVFEIGEEYPKKLALEIFNDKVNVNDLLPGTEYELSFNLESREWQGRWFTSAKLYKISS